MQIMPLVVAIPLGVAFIICLLESVIKEKAKRLSDLLGNLTTFFLLVAALGMIKVVATKGSVTYWVGGWEPIRGIVIGINLVLDGLSVFLLVIIGLVAFMATLFSINYMELYTAKPKYYALFLLMVGGMNGVVLSGDMFNFYVFLEIAAVASYALVAFGTEREELEAAYKYMVMGAVASLFILLAIALLYSFSGTLNMANISEAIACRGINPLIMFSAGLFLMGLGLKAAQVPFHAWLPDAHPAAPAPISAMLSGVLIKALGIYGLFRIFFNLIGFNNLYSTIFMVLGVLSMTVGVFLALGQWDFKRLLAYHSISQMGYVMLGVGLATPLGILGGLFHLVNHAVFKSLLFLNSGAVEYATRTRQLKEMGGLSKKMPITGATCGIASFSIAGIPPFNGFWSKLIIIIACIQTGKYICAGIAILAAVLTLTSFLKVQKYAFFGKLPERLKGIKEVPVFMRISMIILAVLCVGLGLLVLPGVRALILTPAVEVLTNGSRYAQIVLGN